MRKVKYIVAYLLVICIILTACRNINPPEQDTEMAEETEQNDGVTVSDPSGSSNTNPSQDEKAEEPETTDQKAELPDIKYVGTWKCSEMSFMDEKGELDVDYILILNETVPASSMGKAKQARLPGN